MAQVNNVEVDYQKTEVCVGKEVVAQDGEEGPWPPLEFPATLFQRAGGLQPKEYRVEVYSLAGARPVLLGAGPLDLAPAVTFGLQGRMEGAALPPPPRWSVRRRHG